MEASPLKVIVVGCTHAGMTAVKEALKIHPETQITVYERNTNVSFLSCGISLYLGNEIDNLDKVAYADLDDLTKLGANVKVGHDVLKIDAAQKEVTVQDLATKTMFTDHYDKLVMATGSQATLPPVKGIDNFRVQICKTYQQAQAIKQYAQTNHHIVIVGGGYSGVEMAEAYAHTDHEVTLIDCGTQLLNNYIDPEMSDLVVQSLQAHGIDVRLNTKVNALETAENGEKVKIITQSGSLIADIVVACTGFEADTELLFTQVKLDRNGAILTNGWQETSDPSILAAGDVCSTYVNPAQETEYFPLATNALRQGYVVGHNLFGHNLKTPGTQASSALRFFNHTLASTGLTYKHAKANGYQARTVTYHGLYRANFMRTNGKITVKLVYDSATRQILGAQLFGDYDLTQSANALSICIQNRNTIDYLALVDMLFNPHYNQPFNYLNLVAQMAVDQEMKADRRQAVGSKQS